MKLEVLFSWRLNGFLIDLVIMTSSLLITSIFLVISYFSFPFFPPALLPPCSPPVLCSSSFHIHSVMCDCEMEVNKGHRILWVVMESCHRFVIPLYCVSYLPYNFPTYNIVILIFHIIILLFLYTSSIARLTVVGDGSLLCCSP